MQRLDLSVDRTYGHIQVETGDDAPHVIKAYTLVTNIEGNGRQEWNFALRLPRAIADTLGAEDFYNTARLIDTRPPGAEFSLAEATLVAAKFQGRGIDQVQEYLSELMAENLYRRFCERQIALGNKAWLVPRALQKAGLHNGK